MTNLEPGSKVAIVTGAGGVIGSAISLRLLARGVSVIAIDINGEALQNLKGHDANITVIEADAMDEDAVNEYIGQIASRFGRIDILCNNVGAEAASQSIEQTSTETFQTMMRVNVTSAFLNTRAVLPLMREAGSGSIINISSISGLIGSTNDVTYTTAKHAVVGLTRASATELGQFGIRVNCLCPGPIESSLMNSFEDAQSAPNSVRSWYEANTPLSRYGLPEEVASAVAFLASDESTFITGSVLPVDGGLTASGRIDERTRR